MDMNFSEYLIHLNKDILSKKSTKKIFKSLQNAKIVKEKGGFLFKSSISGLHFHIGILPSFIGGERSHHYDIELEYEDEFVFTGFINPNCTIGFLFTPPDKKESISEEYKKQLRKCYILTTHVLIENGFSPDFQLDWITQKLLDEINIFSNIPEKLGQFY